MKLNIRKTTQSKSGQKTKIDISPKEKYRWPINTCKDGLFAFDRKESLLSVGHEKCSYFRSTVGGEVLDPFLVQASTEPHFHPYLSGQSPPG